MKERLANQARAIIELSAENERLLARIKELEKGTGQPADPKLLLRIEDLKKEIAQLTQDNAAGQARILDLLVKVDTLEKEVANLKAMGAPAPAPAPVPPPKGRK
jgi:cell division protein FtsB